MKQDSGKFQFIAGTLLVFALLLSIQTHAGNSSRTAATDRPQRIVSLAPSITETLFALGLGEHVVGVTEFCAWPEAVASRRKVGGYREINPEAILRTGADLVIMPADMAHFRGLLESLGISVQLFDSQSLENFLRDTGRLGSLTGRETQAAGLIAGFRNAMLRSAQGHHIPSVLMALMSPDECKMPLTELTVIGKDGFYNELIRMAGGKNAYSGNTPFPRMSLESIITLNPDIIIVAAPGEKNIKNIKSKWNSIHLLKAPRNGNLAIFDNPGDTVPGPGALETLNKISREISRFSCETSKGTK